MPPITEVVGQRWWPARWRVQDQAADGYRE
jgi:hypothetical protein